MGIVTDTTSAQTFRRDAAVISLIGLAHGTSHFFHLMLPPLFPWLQKDFSLSFTQAGFLMTVFFVISSVGQASMGFVVDRTGPRPVLFAGVALLALSGVVLCLASSYPMLILAAAVAGLGNSVFHPADFTVLNRSVSQVRLGHAFSVHGLSGNLGWAAGTAVMAGVAAIAGWRSAALCAAALGAAVLLVLWWQRHLLADAAQPAQTPTQTQTQSQETSARGSELAFLSSVAVWLCFFFFLFSTGAFGILQNFAPSILGHVYAMPLSLATAGLTTYLLGSAAGMAAGGFMAGRVAREPVLIAFALGAAALVALLLASGVVPTWSVVMLMGVMGFGVGVSGPSRDLLVRKAATSRFGKAAYGRVYGFVYSGLDIGLALSPLVFGPLLDRQQFQIALAGVAVLQIGALLSALQVGRNASLREIR